MDDPVRALELARAEALGSFLGMVDAVLLFHDNGLENLVAGGWIQLRAARENYFLADKTYYDARLGK